MHMRWLGWCLALAVAGAAAAELKVGSERAAQARGGVALREAPKPLARILRTLPFGERVVVQEVSGFYARVRCKEGALGWVRAADIVEPAALRGSGSGAQAGATPDVSAAGRQFDESTEKKYRASEAQLEAAYKQVDALEGRTPKGAEIEAFIREGRLGR